MRLKRRSQVDQEAFVAFVREVSPRLGRAFLAAYGPERAQECLAEALAYGWQHWSRVRRMPNAAGYLYRVGQSKTREKKPVALRASPGRDIVEPAQPAAPGVAAALAELSTQQRVAVVLVHAYGCTYSEAAELMGVRPTTVQNHVQRGVTKLRQLLEVHDARSQ